LDELSALFWAFLTYSFFGFLLELLYARLTGSRPDRKCLLVLPLCPVYGLGALGILLLPRFSTPFLLFLAGGAVATGVEYLLALFYEKCLGVKFWDYAGLPGAIHGRVCLPFSIVWGLLALPLVDWLHPALAPVFRSVPGPVTLLAALTVGADLVLSAGILRLTGDREKLRWYEKR
jgi:uncharacterized membrane protein